MTSSDIKLYPAPCGVEVCGRYSLAVNGQPVHVYESGTQGSYSYAFTYFDFAGSVQVDVVVHGPFKDAKLRPLSAGITPVVAGNKISFYLNTLGNFSLELDGDIHLPLFIFANPIEADVLDAPAIRFFGPGIHEAGEIRLENNETVYVAGGAIVKGHFTATDAATIKILGRGVLDASGNDTALIEMKGCKDVVVEGIIIINQPSELWATCYWTCDDVTVRNVRILTSPGKSNDGIVIISCSNFVVDGCLIRSFDDCVAVKALNSNRRPSRDVVVKHTVLWNVHAYAFIIGAELDADYVEDITVIDCDFIHSQHTETDPNDPYYFYCGAMGIFNGDNCVVRRVRFENIRVEDPTGKFISLKLMKVADWNRSPEWNCTEGFGQIRDVYFRDVRIVDGSFAPSEIISYGFDSNCCPTQFSAHHVVENVTFENLSILNKVILSAQQGGFIVSPFSSNLKFIESIQSRS